MPKLVGVVNITEDSFFDGGRYLDPAAAVDQAHELVAHGADIVEIGPASSHPDTRAVSAAEEWKRLEPVLGALLSEGIIVSVDSSQPATQRMAMKMGATYINDILGFPDRSTYPSLAQSQCKLVVMHAITAAGRATRVHSDPVTIWNRIDTFFDTRIADLAAGGVSADRLILDPGLGFFLGDAPEPSLTVLGTIQRLLERYQLPVMISASRKSFLQTLVGRDAAGTGPATLAAELYAAFSGVTFIRTHDVRAFREAVSVFGALIDTARRSAEGQKCADLGSRFSDTNVADEPP
jgi:dihydropteroate synthase